MAIELRREDFSIMSELGRGAFGRVELVVAPDGAKLALKSFDPMPHALNISDRDRLRGRFCMEVEIQRSLPPEIALPVYCADLEDDSPWFVMPVAQNTLKGLLENREDNLPYLQKALWDVLIALEFLHDEGYVHRDLKPENVLLRDERWVLSDFGLAKGNDFKGLTTSQSAWGTKEYASPETLMYFRRLKPQSDIYSFGCILHDCFGSKIPRIPYHQYNADGPIGDVIKKCTAIDYRERYANVREVREAIFTALNTPEPSTPSKDSEDGGELFLAVETWIDDDEKVKAILVQLRTLGCQVYCQIPQQFMTRIHALDPLGAEDLFDDYAAWVANSGFGFDFCDTLADRLSVMHDLVGPGSLQAEIIMATAELATDHNRWYVMRTVVAMAGSALPSSTARHIARVLNSPRGASIKRFLRTCADHIGYTNAVYSPVIAGLI